MDLRPLTPDERAKYPGASESARISARGVRVLNHDWVDWEGDMVVDSDGLHFMGEDDLDDDMKHEDRVYHQFQLNLKLASLEEAIEIARHIPRRVKNERLEELGFEQEEPYYGPSWAIRPTSMRRGPDT
jgi:hypothetical protein